MYANLCQEKIIRFGAPISCHVESKDAFLCVFVMVMIRIIITYDDYE